MKSQLVSCILAIFPLLSKSVVKYSDKRLCEADLEDELTEVLKVKLKKYLGDMPIAQLREAHKLGIFNNIHIMRILVAKMKAHGIYKRPELSSIKSTYQYLRDEETKERERLEAEAAISLKLAPSLSPRVLKHIQRGEYKNPCYSPSCEGFPVYKNSLQGIVTHELIQRLILSKATNSATEYQQLHAFLTRLRDRNMLPVESQSVGIDMIGNWKVCVNCTYRKNKWNYGERFLPAEVPCKDTCDDIHDVIRVKFTNWIVDPDHSYRDEVVCDHQKYVESWSEWTF